MNPLSSNAAELSYIWKRWASAPWNVWIQNKPEFLQTVTSVLSAIPESYCEILLTQSCPLIILPPVEMARTVFLPFEFSCGVRMLQLTQTFFDRPGDEQQAILAHEFAHVYLCSTGRPHHEEKDADDLVKLWGLGAKLANARSKN